MAKNIVGRLFGMLKKNMKAFVVFHIALTVLVPIIVLMVSFSFSAAFAVMGINLLIGLGFALLEAVRYKLVMTKARIVPIILAVIITTAFSVAFFREYNLGNGFSAVFSKTTNINHSIALKKQQGGYKNISIKLNANAFVETDYWVEKVVTPPANTDGDHSGIEGEGLNNIISDRIILYTYYVFPFDGEYFIAKVSESGKNILEQGGDITLNCLASSPSKTDKQACDSICSDIRTIIYSVDHFEGETNTGYYDDLEKIVGVDTVMLTIDSRNLFMERVTLSASLSGFALGVCFLLFMILFAPHMPKLPEKASDGSSDEKGKTKKKPIGNKKLQR